MSILFTLFAALFAAKLAWNVSLPLWLQRGQDIVLRTNIEVMLLVGMTAVATRPTLVAVVGVCAIAGSYAAAFGLGALLGWRYHRR